MLQNTGNHQHGYTVTDKVPSLLTRMFGDASSNLGRDTDYTDRLFVPLDKWKNRT
jgi:hypothetical protein